MNQSRSEPAAGTGRYAFAALIVANLLLAFGPWMVRLTDVGPVAAGFWRLALAAPFLLLLARSRLTGRAGSTSGLIGLLILGGLFFAADLATWHIGIRLTKLANATLFGNSSSLIFVVYGFLVARQWPRALQAVSLALAAGGAALLLGSSYELSPEHFVGDLFALLAGVFYALYLIAVDRGRQRMGPIPVLAVATAAGAPPLLGAALLLGEKVIPVDWTPLILLAIGSQLAGQGLLVYAMGHLRPVIVGIALLAQPAVTALIGWLVYREALSLVDALGALLICAALVLIRLPDRRA